MSDSLRSSDNAELREHCRQSVHTLIDRYDWQLIPVDALVEVVLDAMSLEGHPETQAALEQRVKTCYTIIHYEACRQSEDSRRRERGYTELFRYLYRAACQRWPDLAEDASQQALLIIYEQIATCRNPGAFLKFALFKLLAAKKQVDHPQPTAASAPDSEDVSEQTIRQVCLEALLTAIAKLPENARQTIVLKFFRGLSDTEISTRMGISAGNVRVIRNRAINQLRLDQNLRHACAQDDHELIVNDDTKQT